MKISIDLFDLDSIDDAIKKVDSYAKDLERKAQELCQRLGATGYQIALDGFFNAIYDGTNDVSVEWLSEDNKIVIRASGYAVMFIEFGTGVTHQTYHPKRGELGIGNVGTYGHGLGKLKGGWRYPAENGAGTKGKPDAKHPGYIHTYGNPANMPMYNASRDIRSEYLKVVREVFKT